MSPISLRSHLLRIVLVAIVPLLLFSAAMVGQLASQQRTTFRRGATERTLALLTAVDTELKRSIASLEALATSEHLQSKNIRAFQLEAQRVHESRTEWLAVSLALPSGQQLMNLLQPFGTDLEPIQERSTFEETIATKRPVIGNVFMEPISGEYAFAVRVPVLDEGVVAYVLSALVQPESVSGLLASQGLPQDWVGVVIDRNTTVVARTIAPERTVGRPASESLRAALSRTSHGWFHGRTIEGWEVFTPYNRSAFSGWSVAMGIPEAAVEGPFRRSLAYLVAFALGFLSLGVGLARIWSRRGARAMEDLASIAGSIGQGDPPYGDGERLHGGSGIAEVEDLRAAFIQASELIRTRSRERDRVVRSLREIEVRLRESDRRKDEFLAMLGHELRNPLGIINTAVHLMKMRTPEEPSIAELRLMMERQVAGMTRLIDDLLDVSRITQGRIQVSKRLCDFVAIVHEVVADHREAFVRSGVRLHAELPDYPLWLMGDRTRLGQVLVNLLNNANKFTSQGGEVDVRLEEISGGEEVKLTVRDTGVGMEPATLTQVFEPFVQVDSTIERSRGGLGLGLALVKGLVELHGGRVAASSEGYGRGATFTVWLPLEPATVLEDDAGPTTPIADRRARVLLIEDNEAASRAMQMFLEAQGHVAEVAHSGPDGIAAARRFHPEVVLCDIGLPGVDGYHVARTLRQEQQLDGVVLIAVTGYGQESDRRRAREAGFDLHLTKPINLTDLAELLARGD